MRVRVCTLCLLLAHLARAQSTPSLYEQAQHLIEVGRPGDAVSILQPETKLHPSDVRLHNLLGIALTAAGEARQANREFHVCIELSPKFRPAYKNLGINEVTLGLFDDAEKHLREAETLGPAEPEIRALEGEIAYQRGRFADAAARFRAGSAYTFHNQALTLHFLESYLAADQLPAALGMLSTLDAANGSPDFQFRVGVLLSSHHQPSEALPYFARVLAAKPDWYEARFNTAVCQTESGTPLDAVTTLEAVPAPPGREAEAEVDNLLAQAYARSGQSRKAIEVLQKAIGLSSEQEDNYLDLANLLLDASQPALALTVVDARLRQPKASPRLHLERELF